jgi:hypothetical protein
MNSKDLVLSLEQVGDRRVALKLADGGIQIWASESDCGGRTNAQLPVAVPFDRDNLTELKNVLGEMLKKLEELT